MVFFSIIGFLYRILLNMLVLLSLLFHVVYVVLVGPVVSP